MKPYDRHGKRFDADDLVDDTGNTNTNQGEGDHAAARRYNEDVRAFVARDQVDGAARNAADALDGPEGPALDAAQQRAARVGKTTLLDRVKGVARNLYHRGRGLIARRRAAHSR